MGDKYIRFLIIIVLFAMVSCNPANTAQKKYSFPAAIVVNSNTTPYEMEKPSKGEGADSAEEAAVESAALKDGEETAVPGSEREESMVEKQDIVTGKEEKEDRDDEEPVIEEFKKAKEACSRAIELKPEYIEAYFQVGSMYSELSMYDKAIEAYKSFIASVPRNADAIYNLAITYLMIDDNDSEMENYKKLIELDPMLADRLYKIIVQNVRSSRQNRYFVQVGAYKNIKYAHQMIRALQENLLYAYIKKENNFNKVRITGIRNESEAKLIVARISQDYRLSPYMRKIGQL